MIIRECLYPGIPGIATDGRGWITELHGKPPLIFGKANQATAAVKFVRMVKRFAQFLARFMRYRFIIYFPDNAFYIRQIMPVATVCYPFGDALHGRGFFFDVNIAFVTDFIRTRNAQPRKGIHFHFVDKGFGAFHLCLLFFFFFRAGIEKFDAAQFGGLSFTGILRESELYRVCRSMNGKGKQGGDIRDFLHGDFGCLVDGRIFFD